MITEFDDEDPDMPMNPIAANDVRCDGYTYPGRDPENGPAQRCRLERGHKGRCKTPQDC